MNIAIVPSWYKSDAYPNLGSFFREQAIALSNMGHNVIILDATLQRKKDYFLKNNFKINKYDDEGVLTYTLHLPSLGLSRFPRLFYKIYKMAINILLNVAIKDININIIHAHSYYPAGKAVCSITSLMNIPVVVTEHSSSVLKEELSKYEKRMLIETVNNSNKFICVSKALKKSIISLTNTEKDILVVPNGVAEIFTTSTTCNERVKNSFIFVTIGNLCKIKNYDLLIKAFHKAFKNDTNVYLHIIGDGILENELTKQIENLEMTKQIKLLGMLSRENVAKELKKSNAYVLSSEHETFNVSCLEALAVGLPVVTTKCGGPMDYVNDSNGLFSTVNDVLELSDNMQYMYNNYANYNIEKISKQIKDEYSFKKIASKIIEIYEDLRENA